MSKILIVDDENSIREIFSHFLIKDGHEVLIAQDGLEAISTLEKNEIDVVVSDIKMPHLSGTELQTLIKKMNSDIQVILVTGEPTVETAAMAVRDQAFDYLVKPINASSLCQTVNRALAVKKLREEKHFLALENERIRKNLELLVEERTRELERMNRELIREVEQKVGAQKHLKANLVETTHALALAIEKRDPYTAGHQERVSLLATAIGTTLGLPEESVDTIYTAGALHDVGKINVPAEILAKPTRLDSEEMALIKKHPRVGFEIVDAIRFPGPVSLAILQHHERLNGSGYPDGLSGDAILLEARIIAVADVVEAMAHHRPYRAALGLQAALDHIIENKNTLYDTQAVEACKELFEKGFSFPSPQ